ncbi:MAG: COG1361 S-layer family protein [Promethearchaeota archaeon]
MKNAKVIIIIVIIVLITNLMVSKNFIQVQAQPEAKFRLDLVDWIGSRAPGTSAEVQLQVTNLHNKTITAILGVLMLSYPFTDAIDGDKNATAYGESLSYYFNLSQFVVLSGEPFLLSFALDIADGAAKGSYFADLELSYFTKSGGDLSSISYATLPVELKIPNTPPEIDWLRPTADTIVVEPREEINFSILCSDRDNDSLEYSWEVDNIPANITEPSFLFMSQENVGVQDVVVFISDENTTISRSWLIETEVPSETSIDISSQYLKAGITSEFNATITNNLWKGRVGVGLQIPSPLIIQGNSSWSFLNVTEDDSIVLSTKIFTPQVAIGNTGSVLFTIQFTDKHGTIYYETIAKGVIIHGLVKVSVFSSDISVTSVNQGGNVVISATLLNTGNTNALFVNASLQSKNNILLETATSKNYLGELEPNSPLPFSVSGIINSSAPLGEHQINCVVYYQNDLLNVFKLLISFTITIESLSQTTSTSVGIDLYSLIIGSGFTLLLGGGTLLAIGFILFRRKSVK